MIDVLGRLLWFYVVSAGHVLQIARRLPHHLGRQLRVHGHSCSGGSSAGGIGQLLDLADLPRALAGLLWRL